MGTEQKYPQDKSLKRIIEFIGYIPETWKKAPISKQLYYARQIKGVTQRQLAKEIKIDATTILEFESELRKPSLKTLKKVKVFIKEFL